MTVFLGTNSFNLVWEDVCKVILNDRLEERIGNLQLPEGLKEGYNRKDKLIDLIEKPLWTETGKCAADTLIPDIISIDCGQFVIFDAKYYNAVLNTGDSPKRQPGIESITKQYLYQLAYKKFIEDHGFYRVRNCFLLPTEEDAILEKGEAVLKMLENLGLENIKVRFIPAKQAYQHYLAGTKMDIAKLNL